MFSGIFFHRVRYFLEDVIKLGELSFSICESLLQKYINFIQANARGVWGIVRQKYSDILNWLDGPAGEDIRRQVSVDTHRTRVSGTLAFSLLDRSFPERVVLISFIAIEVSGSPKQNFEALVPTVYEAAIFLRISCHCSIV